MALMGFTCGYRGSRLEPKPGSMSKQYFLGFEKYLGGSGDPAYPGGPLFNPLGFRKDEKSMKELKLKEVRMEGWLCWLSWVTSYKIFRGSLTRAGMFRLTNSDANILTFSTAGKAGTYMSVSSARYILAMPMDLKQKQKGPSCS
ncbi:hypothetical protein Leryth_019823 [Lithospermum erythrorhizon]|nr:hypothetical protein Leryth_019823 [Lithospermum erythrorhizon]